MNENKEKDGAKQRLKEKNKRSTTIGKCCHGDTTSSN
jgi:hypothetical protein